jgi:hypothetical protein
MRSGIAHIDGDYDRMEHLVEETYRLGIATGQADAITIYGGQLSTVRYGQDRAEEVADFLADLRQQQPYLPSWRPALGQALAIAGRLDDARNVIAPDLESRFTLFPRDYVWCTSMMSTVATMFACEITESAEIAFDSLWPYRDQYEFLGISSAGPIAEALGQLASLLGRDDVADELFLQAVARNQTMRAPAFLARAELNWATALLRRSSPDRKRAGSLARHAVSVAEQTRVPIALRQGRELLASI